MPSLPEASKSNQNRAMTTPTQGSTLADILERVLDKGIVIAGDISVSVGSTELLQIRIRLLISSIDKAREIGINWWENDPYLTSKSQALLEENHQLKERLQSLEAEVRSLKALETSQIEPETGEPFLNPVPVPEKPPSIDNNTDPLDEI